MTQTLHPLDIVDIAECEAPASAQRAQCQICSTVINGANVVNHEACFDESQNCAVVLRQMYCPHCEEIQSWREIADANGRATGIVIDNKPSRTRGQKYIDRFLRKYPFAAGVLQK